MGTWGTGLYSDDFARDLRSTVAALAKLPFDGPKLLDLLQQEEPASNNADDEDHLIFWLVAADQFARRGIKCPQATQRALDIIDKGLDIENMRDRDMSPAGLRKRQEVLNALVEKLRQPLPDKPRKTLKKPQPLLLQAGEVYCYPTMERKCRNPYFPNAEEEKFKQDAWGAMLVLATGQAFDYLSWYAVAPIEIQTENIPTIDQIHQARFFRSKDYSQRDRNRYKVTGGPGTLSKTHMKRMGLQLIGQLSLATSRIPKYMTEYATSAAASDISLSDKLLVQLCLDQGTPVADWLN